MINSKTLRRAVGISQDDVSGNAKPNVPSINDQSVIVGRFRRGRTDKPFKVTSKDYKAILGEDQTNPSYLIVQDAFIAGAPFVWVFRIGKTAKKLSDGSQPTDDKEFEQIALESNLYPVPVYKDDIYTPGIAALSLELRSTLIKPAPVVEAYHAVIQHFNISKITDGKYFNFEDRYTSNIEVLHTHLGSVLKQPAILFDGYKASVELGSISIRYGFKQFQENEGYKPVVETLNLSWVSKFKSKSATSSYAPNASALDIKLSQALQIVNPLIGTDGYSPKPALLNLVLGSGLVTGSTDAGGYKSNINALDIALTQALQTVRGYANSPYQPGIVAFDIKLTSKAVKGHADSGYTQSLNVLDIHSSYKLAGGQIFEFEEAYKIEAQVIDVLTHKFKVYEPLVNDGYQPTLQTLNVSTTQRIK